jgi:hypothetical protein
LASSDVAALFASYAALGFPAPEPVAALPTIAHLFGARKARCGIYLLVFANGSAYIGQAVEVVRRFGQHRQKYDDIVGFSFLPTPRSRLDAVEKALIRRGERLGISMVNTVHVSQVMGDTDLDMVFPPEAQKTWIADPIAFRWTEKTSRSPRSHNQLARFERRFEHLKKMPLYTAVVDLLCTYLCSAVPVPHTSEYTFWAVSCLPGARSYQWPRLACVSVGVMEVFVVGYFKSEPDAVWGFVNVASDVLMTHFGSEQALQSAFPEVEIVECSYRDAGQYQVQLHAYGVEALRALLCHAAVQAAAATLVLRVMRKRATIYGKHHCWQLADAVFDRMNRM